MWPFNKKTREKVNTTTTMSPSEISFTQLDITGHPGHNQQLGPDDWIRTTPLNRLVESPEKSGLPPLDAGEDTVYEIASQLSRIRESVSIPTDGVYCPNCHIANTQIARLGSPCPTCGKDLLKFGWD